MVFLSPGQVTGSLDSHLGVFSLCASVLVTAEELPARSPSPTPWPHYCARKPRGTGIGQRGREARENLAAWQILSKWSGDSECMPPSAGALAPLLQASFFPPFLHFIFFLASPLSTFSALSLGPFFKK